MFGLELLFIAWGIYTVAKDPKQEKEEKSEDDLVSFNSGYDPYRNVLWTFEQRFKIKE